MGTRVKKKIKQAWKQIRSITQSESEFEPERRNEYFKFSGSVENYIDNGAWVVEENISLFHGKANPLRHFSVDDLNNMNVETLPYVQNHYYLYRGTWEGRVVSVKKYLHYREEYLREIVVATQMVTHNNAHKILGCCLETQFPTLVYEWIADETLQNHIITIHENYGEIRNKSLYEWKDRLRNAWEISHVVAYLHTGFPRPIIHRDLKPSNVFLDKENIAKLSGFCFTVSIPEGEEFFEEHQTIGTYGYIAPEYIGDAKLAKSVDVYSFGVLLLVLLSGRRTTLHNSDEIIRMCAIRCLEDNNVREIVHSAITRKRVTKIEEQQVSVYLQLALNCTVIEDYMRPTMVEVATKLKTMITSPESFSSPNNFQGEKVYRIFPGSKGNFKKSETMILKESFSLLRGKVSLVCYFSVHDLNNMNVEFRLKNVDKVLYTRHRMLPCNGYWYQGSWEGRAVLVKLSGMCYDRASGNESLLRFSREIVVATQMATHVNIHRLLGCCLETEYPVIVYEWVESETLKDRILVKDENQSKLPLLEWKDRLRIAWEISQVISNFYTTFQKAVILMNVEPDSIFLDQDNIAKLSNFNICDFIPEGEENQRMARCKNVYFFGALLLFLLTGNTIGILCDDASTQNGAIFELTSTRYDWLTKELGMGHINEIVDPTISENGMTHTQLSVAVELALRCTGEEDSRPTMEDIVTELYNMIKSFESIATTISDV